MQRRSLIAGLAFGGLLASAAEAATPVLGKPTGKVILEVTGAVTAPEGAAKIAFDREMLKGLGLVDLVTVTPWDKTPVRFTGVRLKDLLEAVGATGNSLKISALNDAEGEVPISDAELGAVLAMQRDGQDMPIREKGPLWLVYPWSERPDLNQRAYLFRSVWQIKSIEVR